MNSSKLKNRMVFIESKKKIDVSNNPSAGPRRGKNYLQAEDSGETETFSDIFDIESEFSDLSKSNDLFQNISKSSLESEG